VAEIYIHPEREDYLRGRYLFELWQSLWKHAPRCMAYLREHGVDAWLERYGLPEGLREHAEEYLNDPEGYFPGGWWYDYEPPMTHRLSWHWESFPEYDPAQHPPHRWRERAIKWLESYMEAVEEAYRQAGWKRVRVKYNPEHFVWLALRLEGLTWARIADLSGSPITDDATRRAGERLARELGVRLPDIRV
jgi:hypothetical protein